MGGNMERGRSSNCFRLGTGEGWGPAAIRSRAGLSLSCHDVAGDPASDAGRTVRSGRRLQPSTWASSRDTSDRAVMSGYDQLLSTELRVPGMKAPLRTWNRLQSHNGAARRLRQRWRSRRWPPLADVAAKQRQTYLRYLEVLLAAELEDAQQQHHRAPYSRRSPAADEDAGGVRLRPVKPATVPATKMHDLAQGGYIERAEPVILIGDCGTGKTHLLTGLCVAACRQKRRVRFACPRPIWSMSSSKPNSSCNCGASWRAGNATI